MATYNYIYITTKATKPAKNLCQFFTNCAFQKDIAEIKPMSGKIRDFILDNYIDMKEKHCDWNGYGYSTHVYRYLLTPANGKKLLEMIEKKKVTTKKPKSQDEIIEAWSKRLAKLTGISIEEAKAIAIEKINYKTDQVNMMIDRQFSNGTSVRRGKLIKRMERENPLRRIEDTDHAQRILAASRRHNESNYEELLEEYRHEAALGNIDKGDVRDLARMNMSY